MLFANWFRTVAWAVLLRVIRWKFPQVKQLSTCKLVTWLQQKDLPQLLLLDARTPEEYQVSHLENAQLAPANLQELETTATTEMPIVVYCSVGYRSSKLAQKLQQAGYEQVFNLEGSIFRWMNEGRSVYREGKVVQQIHPYNQFWKWFLRSHLS